MNVYMDTSGLVGWVGEWIQVDLSWFEGYAQLQYCSWQINTKRGSWDGGWGWQEYLFIYFSKTNKQTR